MSWFTTTQEEEDLQNLTKLRKLFSFDSILTNHFLEQFIVFAPKTIKNFCRTDIKLYADLPPKNWDRMLYWNSLKIVNFSKESYENLHQWSPKFVALILLKNRTCDSANFWYQQKLRTQVKSKVKNQKAKFFK